MILDGIAWYWMALDAIGCYWMLLDAIGKSSKRKNGHRETIENRLTNSSSTSVSDQYLPESMIWKSLHFWTRFVPTTYEIIIN